MLENQGEKRESSIFSRIFLGFSIFAGLFLAYAILLSVIYGPSQVSLATGCHWDCAWYQSIIRNGYVSEIPPTAQDINRSNVAFFPLFPLIGGWFSRIFSIPSEAALPLVSIVFAFGIFGMLPFLTDRKRVALIFAYPAVFYFFVGYSESVYCFFLFAGLLLLFRRRYVPVALGILGMLVVGFALGLTRLTGFVIPGGVFGMLVLGLLCRKANPDRKLLVLSAFWTLGAVLGIAAFLAFSQAKFGAWNLYFQTLNIGWHKEMSVWGFTKTFSRAVLKNVLPPWFARYPTRMSWMINADTILLYGYVIYLEAKALLGNVVRFTSERALRFSLLAAGFVHVMITTLGDSGELHRWGNGMRYTMPAFFVLVFLWDPEWTFPWLKARPKVRKYLYFGMFAFWIPYQLYYLYLFTQTVWVS
jgi:hypothetical protein